jgi:glycosyltransferase involved in cell wall biosynthesis
MRKLAIITTHPIQYYAPVFQLLHQNQQIEIKVFYTLGEISLKKHDPGFGKVINWDIPVLAGYPYEWVENTARQPGSDHFKGIVTPQLITQIEAWNPSSVLVFGWSYYGHLKAMLYFKSKVPVYFRGDSTLLDEQSGFRSIAKKLFLKWVYRYVDHAFYVGHNNKAYFKKYGLKDDQLTFAPHAIDNRRFSEDRTVAASRFRRELGIKDNETIILFAGKLENKKSPVLLLDAFLLADRSGVHLLFVGNGALEQTLQRKANGHENIHFVGFQNQTAMPTVYQAADLFCLPSKGPGETWGLAVNEAMACGKAILVSDKCGCAVDLVTKKNGIIFKSEVGSELQIAIQTLVADKGILSEYGQESKNIIRNWDFTHIARAIEQHLVTQIIVSAING